MIRLPAQGVRVVTERGLLSGEWQRWWVDTLSRITNRLTHTKDISSKSITAVKTSAYTAAANEIVYYDTSSGALTITLPVAPEDGVWVGVKNTTTDVTACTVQGGTDSGGVKDTVDDQSTVDLTTSRGGFLFVFDATARNWSRFP